MRRLNAKFARDLHIINDFIHDRAFNLSEIHFDKEARILTIPTTVLDPGRKIENKKFLFFTTWKYPVYKADFIVKNVDDYSMVDNAKVEQGVFNEVAFENGTVEIKNCLPVGISVKTSEMDVELDISDVLVSSVRNFSFF